MAAVYSLPVCIESQKKIDEEVQKLFLRRNTFALITRLPPEILSIIFAFTMCANDYKHKRVGALFYITHICHYWRVTALGYPKLWCNPPMKNPECTLEFLRRSKNAPLNVNVGISGWHSSFDLSSVSAEEGETREEKAISHVLAQMHRIASLSLEISTPYMHRFILDLDKPAPFLEFVQISQASAVMDQVLLFGNQTPRLRHVKLHGLDLIRHWDSSLLKNLQSLELLYPANRPTTAQMLDLLRGMPLIETLKLANASALCLRHHDNVPILTRDAVRLDHLQRLELVDELVNCAQLMALVSLKRTPILVVHCLTDAHAPESHDVDLCLPVFGSFLAGQNAVPLLSASFLWAYHDVFCVKAWATTGDGGYVQSGPPHVSLDLCGVSNFPAVFRHLPLPQIRALELASNIQINCTNALRVYDQVQTVRVEGSMATEFLATLAAHKFPNPSPELQPLFPALKKLKLDRVNFSEKLDDQYPVYQLLQSVVADRSARGSRIMELLITGSIGLHKRVVDRYRKSVGEVIWIGRSKKI